MMRILMTTALLILSIPVVFALCDVKIADETAAELPPCVTTDIASNPKPESIIAPHQGELIDLAVRVATAIPVDPHIKDRSRMQELIVATCLKLDQPQRAIQIVPQIENWRRGACYADLALHYAQRTNLEEADRFLAMAQRVADHTDDWRRDTVNVKIAIIHAWLGRQDRASALEQDVVESEVGKVDAALAARLNEAQFEQQLKEIDERRATGHFDVIRNALYECAELFERFYANADRRSTVEQKVRESIARMPVAVQIEVLMHLCQAALKHEDNSKALELVNEAQKILDAHNWLPEDQIPFQAKLIALRYQAGEVDQAGRDAAALLTFYEQKRERIVDIFRAAALRPLAEAHHAMQNPAAALKVYRLAVADGAVNLNARPRAEDLVATCCSMAALGVEPDEELWSLMQRIVEGLRDPW